MRPLALLLLALTTLPASAQTARWPCFRGETGGVLESPALPSTWDAKTNIAWTFDVPGRGWSSPIVWGDRVYLTTVVREGKEDDPKKGLYFGGERKAPPTDPHRWLVLGVDLKTGKQLWEREVHKGQPGGTAHIKNSYASETPVTDGERVYALFGNQGVYCMTVDGKPVWSLPLPATKTRLGWGAAASPALYKDRLFVVNDNEEKSYLLCLDAKSGKEQWRVERDEKTNWATPYVWQTDGRTEIVTCGSKKVRSYDLDGKLLWEMGGMSSIAIPTPFTGHGLLYVSSGYVLGNPKPVFAVKPGAKGDISLGEDETKNQHVAWANKKAGPYNPSPLLYGDHLYVLYDRGLFGCYNAKTGAEVYAPQRLGATAFTASPWAYDGKVFCLSEDGDTFVIQAGAEFKLLGKNAIDEMALATPALTPEGMLMRTMTKLHCLKK